MIEHKIAMLTLVNTQFTLAINLIWVAITVIAFYHPKNKPSFQAVIIAVVVASVATISSATLIFTALMNGWSL